MEGIVFSIIVWFCATIFSAISIWAFRSKKPVHFWSGTTVSPNEISDTRAYNRACGRMWFVFSLLYWFSGVLALVSRIDLAGALVGIGTLLALPLFILRYQQIYKKYKQ